MKIDWTKNGWRVIFGDATRRVRVISASHVTLPGPVNLILDDNKHGWLELPDLTDEELAALNGEGDATELPAATGSPTRQ